MQLMARVASARALQQEPKHKLAAAAADGLAPPLNWRAQHRQPQQGQQGPPPSLAATTTTTTMMMMTDTRT